MLITPERALRVVLRHTRPLKAIATPLADAVGCCLAEDVRADRDMPPSDRSAMDGYAVRAADLAKGRRELRVVGEVAAGSAARPRVGPGTCAAILTGASVPPGADTVVKIEDTSRRGDTVTVHACPPRKANVRFRGEEARKGRVLIAAGAVLGPARIGLCAAVGKARPRVRRRPRVAVLCTGEELRDAASRVRTHQLRDSNGPALIAALRQAGFAQAGCEIVPDRPRTITARLRRAAGACDVILLTGGVSVGKYDFVPDALMEIAATVRFHGVAMKPGKPQLYATLTGNRHVFGLPGNPLSVLTGFHEFALPALRRLAGVAAKDCQPALRVKLAEPARSKGDRARYVLARLIWTDDGPRVAPIESMGSADLAAANAADGVIIVPAGVKKIPAGRRVELRPWRALP